MNSKNARDGDHGRTGLRDHDCCLRRYTGWWSSATENHDGNARVVGEPGSTGCRLPSAPHLPLGEAGAMAERRVIVGPPGEGGGRRVQVDSETLGTAYSLHDLSVFLERAGLEGLDVVDLVNSPLIEWRGGGPEVWER